MDSPELTLRCQEEYRDPLVFNPYQRLSEVGDVLCPPPPMVLHAHRGDQHLMVASLHHVPDLRHPQYALMGRAFDAMSKLTENEGFQNLVEGRRFGPSSQSLATATIWFGERGWQEWMGVKYGVPVDSGDTPNFSEAEMILKEGFPPEVVLFYYTYRHIAQWGRQVADMRHGFDQYMTHWLQRYKQVLLETGVPSAAAIRNFELDDIHALHAKLLGKPFGSSVCDYWEVLENTVQYWRTDNPVQEVAASCAIKRFRHLLGVLEKRWQSGNSIFTAWGWQHVYAMEQEGSLLPFGNVKSWTSANMHCLSQLFIN